MKTIDLAMKNPGCCAPPSCYTDDDCYPEFHYSGDKDLELPDSGEMTIKFRKVSATSSVDKEGKHRYSCTIEVEKILGADGKEVEPPARGSGDTAAALDKILKTMEEMVEKDEEVHEMMEGESEE